MKCFILILITCSSVQRANNANNHFGLEYCIKCKVGLRARAVNMKYQSPNPHTSLCQLWMLILVGLLVRIRERESERVKEWERRGLYIFIVHYYGWLYLVTRSHGLSQSGERKRNEREAVSEWLLSNSQLYFYYNRAPGPAPRTKQFPVKSATRGKCLHTTW